MKIKYHNKVEIDVGGKHYVSYNKVLRSLYSKISALEPYANYFSLGIGKTSVDENQTKLGSYIMSVQTKTSEISSDPINGVYYVKKVATLDSNDSISLTFSEIGISSDNSSNADIYNHILITDENGNVVDVVKAEGESLTITMTIFLELTTDDNTFLSLGENNLIKLLLGEELEDKTIYAVRGTNMTENISMQRTLPRYDKSYKATLSTSENESGEIELKISAKLGEGEAREVVFIILNSVVARRNIMNSREGLSLSKSYTSSSKYNFVVDSDVSSIVSVTDESSGSSSAFYAKPIAKSFGDEIICPELSTFDNNTKRFVSIDGIYIAFLGENNLTLLKSQNYNLTPVHTGAISIAGLYKLFMLEDYVFVFKNISPYIEIYKIINNICEKQNLYKEK